MNEIWIWVAFNIFILVMIFIDLFVHDRKTHVIGMKEALTWSAFWISLALAFNVLIYYTRGFQPAMEFLTGYLIELSLSVDNLFVFILIFTYFRTPPSCLHKILFWGILGAIVMRAAFIFFGIALINQFHWIIYIFGAFLIFMGTKMAFKSDEEIHPEKNPILNLLKRWIPVTPDYRGDAFFVIEQGKKLATPLFVVLVAVETTDLVFAIDSIPAILAITRDPFIVYSSNIFAILGLRSLFFALAALMGLFHHLHYGIGAILSFVGCKMLLEPWIHIPTSAALGFIVFSLTAAIISSMIFPSKQKSAPAESNHQKL